MRMSFTRRSEGERLSRRDVLKLVSGSLVAAAWPRAVGAQSTKGRQFDPLPGPWRTFEIETAITLRKPPSTAATLWIPTPVVNTDWQRSMDSAWTGNARTMRLAMAGGAQCFVAEFDADQPESSVKLTSRVQTRNRAVDWSSAAPSTSEDESSLRQWIAPTSYKPTDGIVLKIAEQIVEGARTDKDKARRIYDWIIVNTYREPKVRGCGLGDIKFMLESGDLGGKCADLNGLFVGLCRAAGIPARDNFGLRVAPSAFGYRELGGNPAKLEGAQHCRAEVYLRGHGWVAADPADVAKVMRQETGEWIKDADHPIVAPVRKALFGRWEGNWIAYNAASDVQLPGSSGKPLPFLMYPQAESSGRRHDPLDAENFVYKIHAREITA
jgi:transglutaminase-like putative cysteine protease